MDATRRARIESVILEELSVIIPRELKDPRLLPLTFTKVDLSQDGQHATVYIAPLGQIDEENRVTDEHMEACIEGLSSASGYLRRHLAKILTVRHIPSLLFKTDKGLDNSIRVHQLLKQLSSEKK